MHPSAIGKWPMHGEGGGSRSPGDNSCSGYRDLNAVLGLPIVKMHNQTPESSNPGSQTTQLRIFIIRHIQPNMKVIDNLLEIIGDSTLKSQTNGDKMISDHSGLGSWGSWHNELRLFRGLLVQLVAQIHPSLLDHDHCIPIPFHIFEDLGVVLETFLGINMTILGRLKTIQAERGKGFQALETLRWLLQIDMKVDMTIVSLRTTIVYALTYIASYRTEALVYRIMLGTLHEQECSARWRAEYFSSESVHNHGPQTSGSKEQPNMTDPELANQSKRMRLEAFLRLYISSANLAPVFNLISMENCPSMDEQASSPNVLSTNSPKESAMYVAASLARSKSCDGETPVPKPRPAGARTMPQTLTRRRTRSYRYKPIPITSCPPATTFSNAPAAITTQFSSTGDRPDQSTADAPTSTSIATTAQVVSIARSDPAPVSKSPPPPSISSRSTTPSDAGAFIDDDDVELNNRSLRRTRKEQNLTHEFMLQSNIDTQHHEQKVYNYLETLMPTHTSYSMATHPPRAPASEVSHVTSASIWTRRTFYSEERADNISLKSPREWRLDNLSEKS